MKYLLKEKELDNSSKPNQTRAKGCLPEKNTTSKKELLALSPGEVTEGSWCYRWKWWVRTTWANQKSIWQRFGVFRVKFQKVNFNPVPIFVGGGGLALTQHHSCDTETDDQHNTRDGSSEQPGARLQISYFTDKFAVNNILLYLFGTGEDNE
jgi:hypothetical protein